MKNARVRGGAPTERSPLDPRARARVSPCGSGRRRPPRRARTARRRACSAGRRAPRGAAKAGRDQHRPKHKAPERVAHALAIAEGEGALKYTRAPTARDRPQGKTAARAIPVQVLESDLHLVSQLGLVTAEKAMEWTKATALRRALVHDDGEPRAMKKDTDSDSDRDSEHVGNHRRGRMTSGPRRSATFKAKRLAEGNHGGTDQQPNAFECKIKSFATAIGSAGDPPEYDSEDSMPSLVDDSVEHRDGERPEVVPFKQFPAYMPPCTQHLEHEDRALLFAPVPFGHWESSVSLAIVRSVGGGSSPTDSAYVVPKCS